MLNENLVKFRKDKGLTQEALAVKLNVVRQTVSKWEKGTAVPDADTLCRIAEALEVPVAQLLGAENGEASADTAAIATALAQINEQLAIRNRRSARAWKALCLLTLVVIAVLLGKLYLGGGPNSVEKAGLPDIIEASGADFMASADEITCSFVPSSVAENMVCTVSFHGKLSGSSKAFPAEYAEGQCTLKIPEAELSPYDSYDVVLTVELGSDKRNVPLASGFSFEEGSCSWTPAQ